MSRRIGAVEFEDGHRMYLLYNGTVDIAFRALFDTPEAPWAWYESGKLEDYREPENAAAGEEPVVLITDLTCEPHEDGLFRFHTRASRHARWITGPNSEEEAHRESDEANRADFRSYMWGS